jgi:SAM-dependent methyltransferase
MADIARSRGVEVIGATAEELPFGNATFDLVLMVTTICFLDNIGRAFGEAHRVLRGGGHLVVGFLDRETELGRVHEERRKDSVFYRWARFRSSEEVQAELGRTGFGDLTSVQTIFSPPGTMVQLSAIEPGSGTGLFVVMRGSKELHRARAPQ